MKASHEDTKARSNAENTPLPKVHAHLRLLKIPLGLLINFGSPTFKEGCQRIVNRPQPFVASCLRVNQIGGAT